MLKKFKNIKRDNYRCVNFLAGNIRQDNGFDGYN